ncbi:MAG: DNA-binding response regulator [Balneola sp.]|jgi:DNA-binding NarL/FixJ family response regulator|nr:DNA-binding response regulator [Balneola sp.]MBE78569.1 DNA-binding response regulator [Balneola sp.]HBX67512.1 DNA-binding response regulator [Balneolaceae bacterium]|tara:strand:- start:143 stop:814 length:672 start_codon:yes stop_codon:yes gene_type:complete
MDIRIGIVEDQLKVAERLKTRLSFYDHLQIVMHATNARESMDMLNRLPDSMRPQIILMDIEMPGKSGIEATREIKAAYPEIDILIQTVFEEEDKIFQSIHAGASGYLLKDDPIQKYVDAMEELMDGGAALSPKIASKLMMYVQNVQESKSKKKEEVQAEFSLTDREMDILEGIVDDLTAELLADRLFISPHTVRVHIKSIYKKLHVHSRASAVRFAITKGLFS